MERERGADTLAQKVEVGELAILLYPNMRKTLKNTYVYN